MEEQQAKEGHMATLETVQKLHRAVGDLPPDKMTARLKRWHAGTSKILETEERIRDDAKAISLGEDHWSEPAGAD